MARTNQRGKNNNNAEGRNQYSNGWVDSAKDKPFTAAAAAAAAVGAGAFLWSRRNQISDQINRFGDQLSVWADDMRSNRGGNASPELETVSGESDLGTTASRSTASRRSTSPTNGRRFSETGAGNTTLGAPSGSTGIGTAS